MELLKKRADTVINDFISSENKYSDLFQNLQFNIYIYIYALIVKQSL